MIIIYNLHARNIIFEIVLIIRMKEIPITFHIIE